MSESQLLGRSLPTGDAGQFTFCCTPFLDCYENGGLFLFDEIDAADPDVVLVVNSALANGHLNIPRGTSRLRPSGTPTSAASPRPTPGAAGRIASTAVAARWTSATLEAVPAGGGPGGLQPRPGAAALARPLWGRAGRHPLHVLAVPRLVIAENRLEQAVTTRDLIAFAKAIARGKSVADVESKLFAGWRDDEVRKVKGAN